jgi:hypothetical protein
MKVNLANVGAAMALMGVGLILRDLLRNNDTWKEATENVGPSEAASQPASVSRGSDRDNGAGIRDLRVFHA